MGPKYCPLLKIAAIYANVTLERDDDLQDYNRALAICDETRCILWRTATVREPAAEGRSITDKESERTAVFGWCGLTGTPLDVTWALAQGRVIFDA